MSITHCDLKLENSNKLDELLLIKMKNGYKILGYKNDCITQEIQRDGFYEFALYTFINLYLDFLKNAICVDVGANIGCHTLSMARHAQKVICFEPNPQVFKILSQTITLNKLQNVLLRNYGLSNSEEQKILNVNTKGNIGASSLHVSDSDSNSLNIKLKLGEQEFIDHAIKRIDLIKIDIEGHEAEAILGMQESIKKYRPVVVLEWNCDRTREKFSRNEIFQKVFNGFVTVVLSDNHSNFCQSVRKAPFIKIFRKCLNPLHKTFMRRKLILNAFNYSENYGHLLIIPNEKIHTINELIRN